MLTIMTGWSPKGWNEYGKNFIATFGKFWPRNIRLVVYTEEYQDFGMENTECRSVLDIPGCGEFISAYRDDKAANGRLPLPKWKESCKIKGYNFKFDAWKFCRQGYIPLDAYQKLEHPDDTLCWFDGDVTTYARVTSSDIERLLPADKHVAYLGRGLKHSEIGFQLYRQSLKTEQMLQEFRDLYEERRIFKLKEWHSAFAFDYARKKSGVEGHDLTPGGTANVWQMSPLIRFSDHLKGNRKVEIK